MPAPFKAQRIYADTLELYLNTPKSRSMPNRYSGFEWAVRAQFTLKSETQIRHFPTPSVKDSTRYGPEFAKADFNKTNRPFWADEQTHKAT